MNLFGWTVIGWLVAWLIAFRDYRRVVHVTVVTPPRYEPPEERYDQALAPTGQGHPWYPTI